MTSHRHPLLRLARPPAGHQGGFAPASSALLIIGLLMAGAGLGPTRAQPADDPQAVAVATGSGPLETSIEVQRLAISEGPGGKEIREWVPPVRLSVGDEVHYTVRVRNPGKAAVEGIVVTKRLPFGVRYLRNSAVAPAAEVQFSIDGGKTFATSDALARAARGTRKTPRNSLESDYTHVRWVLSRPLGPASTALLRFRATFS